MNTFRARIRPRSAARTPWLADTLFGQLCWQVRYDQGEAGLAELLAHYRAGAPPLLFSDGFPVGWLPGPIGFGAPSLVREAAFEALRRGERVAAFEKPAFAQGRVVLKGSASRLNGAWPGDAPASQGYRVEELALAEPQLDGRQGLDICVYVRAADSAWATRARGWLEQLALGGYGAGKSAGYGQFELIDWEAWPGFNEAPPRANSFISLSNWVPARHDPTDGSYATLVKYGRLGEELAASSNPFKLPLLMLAAGSYFRATPARPWYGRLVEQIAELRDLPIVQYGYAFAVAAALPIPST